MDYPKDEGEWVMAQTQAVDARLVGQLTAIHGSVVDIRFPEGRLPAVDEGLEIDRGQGLSLIHI